MTARNRSPGVNMMKRLWAGGAVSTDYRSCHFAHIRTDAKGYARSRASDMRAETRERGGLEVREEGALPGGRTAIISRGAWGARDRRKVWKLWRQWGRGNWTDKTCWSDRNSHALPIIYSNGGCRMASKNQNVQTPFCKGLTLVNCTLL